MALVNALRVVQLQLPASLESQNPRVKRVLRNHLEIMNLKDQGVNVGCKGQAVLLELKTPLAPSDQRDPRVKLERRVIQVLEVFMCYLSCKTQKTTFLAVLT